MRNTYIISVWCAGFPWSIEGTKIDIGKYERKREVDIISEASGPSINADVKSQVEQTILDILRKSKIKNRQLAVYVFFLLLITLMHDIQVVYQVYASTSTYRVT